MRVPTFKADYYSCLKYNNIELIGTKILIIMTFNKLPSKDKKKFFDSMQGFKPTLKIPIFLIIILSKIIYIIIFI